ncbi:hypothetical protein ACA758_03540 [Mycoplasmopsis agassizii]|uniref:hypothetical protein n=1 Tax=Mycoplasmopsis agassizii TaxID=33922 RepID=UPI0035298D14
MSHLDTQNFNKKAKIKKIFISSALLAIPIFSSFAIACTPTTSKTKLTEEDKRFAETGKGTDLSVKILDSKKTVIQLKYAGYEYFTFSDYWWSEDKTKNIRMYSYGNEAGIDAEKSINGAERNKMREDEKFAPNNENSDVFFKVNSLDEIKKEIAKKTVLGTVLKQVDQKSTDKQFKSISLITDEASLKTQLRTSEEENEKFSKFAKEKINASLKDDEIEKMKPWNSYFNYDLINKKLDLKNNNYLFVKDLTHLIVYGESFGESGLVYHKVDKGIQMYDYIIDTENKTLTLKFSYFNVPQQDNLVRTLKEKQNRFTGPNTITSFLLPVPKSELNDFDFNEWKIITEK